jgi:hypothetical protein
MSSNKTPVNDAIIVTIARLVDDDRRLGLCQIVNSLIDGRLVLIGRLCDSNPDFDGCGRTAPRRDLPQARKLSLGFCCLPFAVHFNPRAHNGVIENTAKNTEPPRQSHLRASSVSRPIAGLPSFSRANGENQPAVTDFEKPN